jgi:hypothetical protein
MVSVCLCLCVSVQSRSKTVAGEAVASGAVQREGKNWEF